MRVHVCTYKRVFTETVLCAKSLSHVQLCAILWTVACQGPLSMGFSRQEYCSGLPFPSLRDLLDPVIEPRSPVQSQGDSLPSEPPEKPNFLLLSCIYQDGILH